LVTQQLNDPDKEVTYPHLTLFCRFLDVMDAANISDDCTQAFSCQYFLALHKDSQDDKTFALLALVLMYDASLVP